MMLSTSYLDDIVTFDGVKILNPLGHRGDKLVRDSQLTPVVKSPSEYLVLVVDVERVLVATENIYRIFGANFLDLQCLLIFVSCVQHSTDLAGLCVSPSVDFSTGCQCQSVVRSTGHLLQSCLRFWVEKLLGYSRRCLNF